MRAGFEGGRWIRPRCLVSRLARSGCGMPAGCAWTSEQLVLVALHSMDFAISIFGDLQLSLSLSIYIQEFHFSICFFKDCFNFR